MCELHLTVGIMSRTALFKTLCVKGGTHPKIPLLAPGDVVTGQLLQFYEKTLEQYGTAVGILSVLHWAVALENQENQTFVGLYQGEYKTPPSHFAVSAYDAGRLLVQAL